MKRIDDQARVINFYQLWELLPQAGKIEQVLFEITDVNGKTGKLIVKNADKVELLNKKLIQELREKGEVHRRKFKIYYKKYRWYDNIFGERK